MLMFTKKLLLTIALFVIGCGIALGQPVGGAIIYATNYGVVANTGADETVALQNAVSACDGVILQLPAGEINISSTISSTTQCIIRGTGSQAAFSAPAYPATIINQTVAGQGVFSFTTLNGVVLRDLGIDMPLGAAGAGISIQSGVSNNLNRGSHIENVSVWGGGTGIFLFHCANYTIRDSFILNFSSIGIYAGTDSNMPDIGDSEISGNTIWDFNITTGVAGLRLDPQAGVEVVGNKFLSADFAIWLTISSGPTGTLNIAQNSLEQQTVAHIYVQQATAGATYADITITGNEMENYGISSFQDGITIANNTSEYLSDLAITGNTIRDCGTLYGMVDVQAVVGATITGNVLDGCGSGSPGIVLGGNAQSVVESGNVQH